MFIWDKMKEDKKFKINLKQLKNSFKEEMSKTKKINTF